ncbi:MAG: hypothetical protein QME87_09895 [Bacillota bacterium]|nr:hypothetical protein [Bacillota bacterium]
MVRYEVYLTVRCEDAQVAAGLAEGHISYSGPVGEGLFELRCLVISSNALEELEHGLKDRGVAYDAVIWRDDEQAPAVVVRFRPPDTYAEVTLAGDVYLVDGRMYLAVDCLRALLSRPGRLRAALRRLIDEAEPVPSLGGAG